MYAKRSLRLTAVAIWLSVILFHAPATITVAAFQSPQQPMIHSPQLAYPPNVRIASLSKSALHSTNNNINKHSASDWLYNLQSLPQSHVLKDVRNPVVATMLWSAIVSGLYQRIRCVAIPATAHGFLVSALGLLLVFRTNSAYQRFYVSTVIAFESV
jgi:hypothetical protein